jgi:hypothetical protein
MDSDFTTYLFPRMRTTKHSQTASTHHKLSTPPSVLEARVTMVYSYSAMNISFGTFVIGLHKLEVYSQSGYNENWKHYSIRDPL